MPLTIDFATIGPIVTLPASLTTWTRLEVQPTGSDLAPALAAEVADPLWFLARQWQFGELTAEDAGSPVEVRLEANQSTLRRYHAGAAGEGEWQDFDPAAMPLEMLVEAEPHGEAGALAGIFAGQQFRRMLAEAGQDAALPDGAFAFAMPDEVDIDLDRTGADWAALADGRAIDGHRVARAIADAGGVPPEMIDAPGLKEACLGWLGWYRGGIDVPPPSAWRPQRLEYAFAASPGARATGPAHVLAAEEYVDGRLDWYSFDLAADIAPGGEAVSRSLRINPLLPAPVRFGGMPADRFWEFEDARVNLSQVRAGPTDLGRLLLLEFALTYGNDWFVIPVDLPVGALFSIGTFTVRDTFGEVTDLSRSGRPAGSRWRMFELSGAERTDADTFLLAPAIEARLQGDPIEEVALFRDEMANMAWAVERTVPGAMGLPVDRYREAGLAAAGATGFADLTGVTAEMIYRVATPVAEHWLPLVAVPRKTGALADFGIMLERRAMLRHTVGTTPEPIWPRGVLMRTDRNVDPADEPAQRLEDEEVPREGVVVTRAAQFTRWIGGERLHWIGRRKAVGRGEGASGLRYDVRQRRKDVLR